jgi:putative membrane protein insertion efficiency factor
MRVPRRRRLVLGAAAVAALAALAADLVRAPRDQTTTRAAVAAVHLYQRTASRVMPSLGVRCRFEPTCSRYAEAVLARDGVLRGGWLTLRRLARCGPWTPAGTVDPP